MLSAIFRRSEQRAQATTWGSWPGETTQIVGGVAVDEQTSMQLLTVYGCVRLITDSIATLPIDVYRRTGDDTKVEIAKPIWLRQPTVDLDFTSWVTQVLSSLLLHGNAFVVVLRNETGGIVELVPLDPAKVRVTRDRGRKAYMANGQRLDAEVVHLAGLMLPGSDVGLSPVEYARQSIGLGLAAVKFGTGYFEGEGNMPGVIEMPGAAQPDTLKAIAEQWRRRRRDGGRGLPGVLQEGATWKPTGVTNEQAQFLATRKFTAAEIAGQMFMVDPSELGIGIEGSSLTYANLEQRNTRFVRVTLLPWIVRLEKALSDLLAQPRYVKFNINALMRGDLSSRYAAYATGIGAGFLEPNEARDWEDLPPLDTSTTGPQAEQLNGVEVELEMRERRIVKDMPDMHFHLPERHDVQLRQEAPIVHVAPPVVHVAAPVVNVPPAEVTVNVPAAEVTVNMPPTEIEVNVEPADNDAMISFVRDPQGRIIGATKIVSNDDD